MFYIACIVYNKKIADVGSLKQFQSLADKYTDVRILFYDNSTNVDVLQANQSGKYPSHTKYVNNKGNVGLSKAYNKVLDAVNSEDWIFWADDDTDFSDQYLGNVYQAAKNGECNIIAGVVQTTVNTILSPIQRNPKKYQKLSIDTIHSEVYCINSGLCMRRSLYDVIGRYDERMFIDMIDYWLFDELRKYNLDKVLLVRGSVIQNFSGNEAASFKKLIGRFKIFTKDFNQYCTIEHKSFGYRSRILIKRFINILRMSFLKG